MVCSDYWAGIQLRVGLVLGEPTNLRNVSQLGLSTLTTP